MSEITTASLKNRRSSRRMSARSSATVEVRRGNLGLGRNLAVLLLDISEGGVCVVLKEALEPMDETAVLLSASGLVRPIKRISTIRWAVKLEDGNYCIGVTFDKRIPYAEVSSLFKPF